MISDLGGPPKSNAADRKRALRFMEFLLRAKLLKVPLLSYCMGPPYAVWGVCLSCIGQSYDAAWGTPVMLHEISLSCYVESASVILHEVALSSCPCQAPWGILVILGTPVMLYEIPLSCNVEGPSVMMHGIVLSLHELPRPLLCGVPLSYCMPCSPAKLLRASQSCCMP